MADTPLSETGWKKFAKGRDLKDAAVLKALAALDKAAPADQPKAVDELGKQLDALGKLHKADKELAAHLRTLDAELKTRRKQAEQAAAQAASADGDDDGDDSPALLTTRMLPLLRQVRNGDTLHAMVALLGKQTVVLVSRRAVGPSQRKLLATQLGTASGVKFIVGQLLFEANAHTFVVQSQAGGLAKRLKSALLEQTRLRLNVRVRGDNPDDVDQDVDEADSGDGGSGAPAAAGSAQAAAADDALAALQSRLDAVRTRVQQAVRDQHPQGARLHALLEFATGKAKGGQALAAEQALAAMAPLLGTLAGDRSAAPAGRASSAGSAGSAGSASNPTGAVNYAKARLAWLAARKKTQADLQTLRQAIVAVFGPGATDNNNDNDNDNDSEGDGDDSDDTDVDGVDDLSNAPTEFPDLDDRLAQLDTVLETLDGSLTDTLDAALNAADPARRSVLHQQAQRQIADFLAHVDSDPLLARLDSNPFVPLTVHATLQATLRTLAATLKAG